MNNDKNKVIKNKDLPKSIRSVVRMYPSNQVNRQFYGGLPHIGNALWGSWNSLEIQRAAEAYDDYSLSTNLLIDGHTPPTKDKVRLGGGSPARFEPFTMCITEMKRTLDSRILSDYPLAAGDTTHKVSIIKYFNAFYSNKIDVGNIIFTHSSTQAFSLVMESIVDYGDVVLNTAPNYGLFSFIPERKGGRVKLLNLHLEDNWKINPKKLKARIRELNKELRLDYDRNRSKYIFRRSDNPPKVVAFINLNPHNPTGVVYGRKDKDLLRDISSVCKDAGVFIIDDLAYSGLEYDRDNTALPFCSLDGHFANTITLYSLSKAYGLAGIRAGMIIANEVVSSLIRDRIFQEHDSLSLLQSSAMSAIFSMKEGVQKQKEEYLAYVTNEYYKRYIFVKSIILGIDALNGSDRKILDTIVRENKLSIDIDETTKGIKDVDIIIEPQSGFFVLLDLSKLLGKTYKKFKIVNDKTLLQFLYTAGNIKTLTGRAFCWTDDTQLVIRVTTALKYSDLLKSFLRLKKILKLLV